jgi:hypothetical protein
LRSSALDRVVVAIIDRLETVAHIPNVFHVTIHYSFRYSYVSVLEKQAKQAEKANNDEKPLLEDVEAPPKSGEAIELLNQAVRKR